MCYNYQITLSFEVLVDQKIHPAARAIRNGFENRRNTIVKQTQHVLETDGCGGRSPCSPSTRFPARAAPRRGGCPAGEAARSGERLKAAAFGDKCSIPYQTRHHSAVQVATQWYNKIGGSSPLPAPTGSTAGNFAALWSKHTCGRLRWAEIVTEIIFTFNKER